MDGSGMRVSRRVLAALAALAAVVAAVALMGSVGPSRAPEAGRPAPSSPAGEAGAAVAPMPDAVVPEALRGYYLPPSRAASLETGPVAYPYGVKVYPATLTVATVAGGASPVSVPEAGSAPGYSSTNVQVRGVDEVDIVKVNGSHVFVAHGEVLRVYHAWPPEGLRLAAQVNASELVRGIVGVEQLVVRSRLGERVVANATPRLRVEGVFVHGGGVVVVAVEEPRLPGVEPRTWLLGLDRGLGLRWARSLPGVFFDARLSGDTLVAVTTWWGLIRPLSLYAGPGERRLEAAPALLLRRGGGSTTVAAVSLSDGRTAALALEGVRPEALLVLPDGTAYLAVPEPRGGGSLLAKLRLSPDRVAVEAETTVPGRLGKQWQLDVHKGVLRVVATGWEPGRGTIVSVYTYDAETLRRIGSLEGVAVNERVHGVRFIGDTLYLVTFRSRDPLFAIDLRDPGHPRVIGYLKAPGFDEYLHPLSNDTLLGIGTENGSLRVTLYRLGGAAPEPAARLYLGKAWTPLLDPRRGHRAFTAKALGDGRYLVLIPASVPRPGHGTAAAALVVLVDAGRGELRLQGRVEAGPPRSTSGLRTAYIDDTGYLVAPGSAPEVTAFTLAQRPRVVAEAPRPVKATVEEILGSPGRYAGRLVEVVGTFMGWKGGATPPPVTRSDWLLAGRSGAAIYVHGAPPLPPEMAGHATLRVTGFVKTTADGTPYIDPVAVEVLSVTKTSTRSSG